MIDGEDSDTDVATDPIDEISARVRERFGPDDAPTAEELIRAYYDHVVRQDLEQRSPAELYGAAISHLQLARHRSPGQPLLRVYVPTVEDDGWRSPHTVIDLVTDDSPFIVASVLMAVERAGLEVHLLIHPVLQVRRDGDRLVGTAGSGPGTDLSEAFVHLEVDRVLDPDTVRELERNISAALDAIRDAVTDWRPMAERANQVAAELEARSTTGSDEISDAAELLRWMAADEFVFLGARDYRLDPAEGIIRSVPGSGLGILRHRSSSERPVDELAPAGVERVLSDDVLLITKTNARSLVHRPVAMDYVGVRTTDPSTGVMTERRFIGLFTARAYTETVTRLPVVRRKVSAIIERAGFTPGSHDANRLLTVLEGHPRDELFEASVDELYPTILAIVHLYERRQVRLFTRHDPFGRSVSCLVFVPRDRFRTEVREAIQQLLETAFHGRITRFEVTFSSASLARLHLIVNTPDPDSGPVDLETLEHRLERVTRTWEDHLEHELVDQLGEGRGTELAKRWRSAFPAGYREGPPELAVADIERLEHLADEPPGTISVHSYHPPEADEGVLHIKLYRSVHPAQLSTVLPLLQNHGVEVLDEHPYQVTPDGGRTSWIHDFGLLLPRPASENIREHGDAIRTRLEESFTAAWTGDTDSDPFAQLVLLARMDWREVAVVRAFAQYLRQSGASYTPNYIQEVTTTHPGITRLLIDRFHLRLDPDRRDPAAEEETHQWILDALEAVPRLDEDRILRGLDTLIGATVRTNLYQRGGSGAGPVNLAFKLDPGMIPDLPEPRPQREIFVSSPRVEGVHLRAGRVARGGIRWSDRREDYRTEVLALMKAQVVKNSVIVPAGAKGGFVCRQLRADAEPQAVRAEVETCYRLFIDAMLDITDNRVDGEVVTPDRVVRLDGDDPYLVVAADRGTATFSDLANSIALERGFWLGDAFASGGSTGYDHKEMGITARGAWVSVRRHLAELGLDPDIDPFSVVGIGDMSGDVFGNGMLLSPNIRLIAAFDHRHVFIDPDPDPVRTFDERARLFGLRSSTWADFDRSVLSEGGMIVPRSAKAINVDERVAAALGCPAGRLTPSELISAILAAPVDLLWNGGIGTYVKASAETHDDVDDRANDAVRIDADELRCRVIGEGGNLGLTQRARVQAALGGVLLNTDAVDNSGGVDCSDREVNLKILLDQQVAAGTLTLRQRNELLRDMTDEVAALVLADNEAQTLALASARVQAPGMAHVHARHLSWLEAEGGLDRELEALPSDDEIDERANDGRGLTQPELAVLMAYTKNVLADHLEASPLPDDPAMLDELDPYMPPVVLERFPGALADHRLKRELIATQLTNRLVNRAGISMTLRLMEETAASVPEVARAHLAAWRIHELDHQWSTIEALERDLAPSTLIEMLLSTKRLGERATRWLIRNRHSPLDVDEAVAELRPAVTDVVALLGDVAPSSATEDLWELRDHWIDQGVPRGIATETVLNSLASTALDIVTAARSEGAPLDQAARVYWLIDDHLGLGWLRRQIDRLPRDDMWTTLARTALRDDLFHEHASVVRRILARGGRDDAETRVDHWVGANQEAIERTFDVLLGIRAVGQPGLEHLTVGLREIRNLMRRASSSPVPPPTG
ncbi:MAG: NAD-glutamate dehydrogenase [Acidimicrobiales bacterium]